MLNAGFAPNLKIKQLSKPGNFERYLYTGSIVLLSMVVSVLICEWKGSTWERKVRFTFYDIFLDSFPDYAPNICDPNGVPRTFYPEQNGITPGWQYNGTIVANYAIDYYRNMQHNGDTLLQRKFMNCLHWLDSAVSEVKGHALYLFHWRQPWYPLVDSPFTSGMTSGLAIEAFTYGFLHTGDSAWLQKAARLVRGFDLEVKDGGFTYIEPNGWWYEEIADSGLQTPRILDGHIFSLTGLQAYYAVSKDTLAKRYFRYGLDALKAALPSYDRGDGYVYYDAAKKIADENYHPLLVNQMKQMFEITGETVFNEYYEKWNTPLAKPYMYKVWRDGNKTGWLLYGMVTGGVFILFLLLVIWLRRLQPRK